MKSLEAEIRRSLPGLFEALGLGPARLSIAPRVRSGSADFIVQAAGREYVIEAKAAPRVASARDAAARVVSLARSRSRGTIPVVVAPFVGAHVAEAIRGVGASYVDLSGNAHVEAPGLLVHVEGKPNRHRERGRPASVFAPTSARVVRRLLLAPNRSFKQSELAELSEVGRGYVSRIVRQLAADGLIEVLSDRRVRPQDPAVLLDAWAAEYDFSRHHAARFAVAAKSGAELLQRVAERCARAKTDYAVTGLGAAWAYDRFAAFRLLAVYLTDPGAFAAVAGPGAIEDARGSNLWLVVPNDGGVFHGSSSIEGVRCVSRVQAFLDLQAMPERAPEAAAEMRRRWLRDVRGG